MYNVAQQFEFVWAFMKGAHQSRHPPKQQSKKADLQGISGEQVLIYSS